MEIKTKFDLGQKVYVISNGKITEKYIRTICIDDLGSLSYGVTDFETCLYKMSDLEYRSENNTFNSADEAKDNCLKYWESMKIREIARVEERYQKLIDDLK